MASETAGANSLPPSTAARTKLRLRTGLAMQLLVLIGVGLFLLGTFVVRQTRNDLVRQVDNTLRSSLRGRVRDLQIPRQGENQGSNQVSGQRENQGVDRTTGQPGLAPQHARTNPATLNPPSNAPLRATPVDPINPIDPINPTTLGPDSSRNQPPRPEDTANQDLPPSATVTFNAANQQLWALASGTNGQVRQQSRRKARASK